MATVTITITDEPGGLVNIKMVCDPPIDMTSETGTKNTPAHSMGVTMLEAAQAEGQSSEHEME